MTMVSRRSDLICREVDGTLVGLDVRSSRYFSLNATGALLWGHLDNEIDPPALVDVLTREHRISPQQAAAEVESFISSLKDQDLLAP
jgi:hypothetical protein